MESLLKNIVHPLRFNIILLGKTGNGKSASVNTILGKKSFKSVTQEVQMDSVTVDGVTLNVYDTPGTNTEFSIPQCQSFYELDESARTVILLVIKAEKSAFEEQTVQQIRDSIPECLVPNTWILFTKGDELERENLTIENFIEDSEEVKKLLKRFQNQYHVFNNFSQSPDQVTELINKIKQAPEIISPEMGYPRTTPPDSEKDSLHRRIMLVGKTGVGKSTTGNTILGENRFRSKFSSSSVTSKCELNQAVVSGRNVSIIDTPGLFDTKIRPEELEMEIGRSIYLSSPGPHAFLYVQPVNIRFTEQEENVFQKLELIFGREMKTYTMIFFTYGDLLEESVDMLIQENSSLSRLVNECGGGYHVFNNKQLENREQVTELLEKINRMVERNGGTYYSNQMYEEAARLRQEEEEQRVREERERLRQEEEENRVKKEREMCRREEQMKRRRGIEDKRLWREKIRRRRSRKEENEKLNREASEGSRICDTIKNFYLEPKDEGRMREETERLRRKKEEEQEEEEEKRRNREETKRPSKEDTRGGKSGFEEFYRRNRTFLLLAREVAYGAGCVIGAIVGVAIARLVKGVHVLKDITLCVQRLYTLSLNLRN